MNRKTRQYLIVSLLLSALLIYQVGLLHPSVIKVNMIPYDEPQCGCQRWAPSIGPADKDSLCSAYSTTRGGDQNVVSYTIYGDLTNHHVAMFFYDQMESRIDEVSQYYEGWIVRLYHNKRNNDTLFHDFLCPLYCKYSNFDPCQVRSIKVPEWLYSDSKAVVVGTQNTSENVNIVDVTDFNSEAESSSENIFASRLIGKTWRYLAMADPLVSDFLVRDVDSDILPREVMAVKQWLEESTAGLHVMRDHPQHEEVILAGMWGGSRRRIGSRLNTMFQEMLQMSKKNTLVYDQELLREVVWPKIQDSIFVHDSYHCRNPHLRGETVPVAFPTKRNDSRFVGGGPVRPLRERTLITPCPLECRPIHHKDWKLC